ncbi:MAG: LysM peptidoglycan-binding domain-containing protein [Myxococcales bacterium]|nr:LysM peptidoglycan-binding domain-containing protein [Myxococcales bacterium]
MNHAPHRLFRSLVPPVLALALLLVTLGLEARTHRVQPGDTVARIARKYRVDPNVLMQRNRIKSPDELRVGTELDIPPPVGKNARQTHLVKSGDTVARIARKYGVQQDDLRGLNDLGPKDLLKLGQLLQIPRSDGDCVPDDAATPKGADKQPALPFAGGVRGLVVSGVAVADGVDHTVQPTQSLAMIARAYGVDEGPLARANGIARRAKLNAGQVLRIPGAVEAVPVRTAAYRPHPVQFIRLKKTQRMKLVLTFPDGRIRPQSRAALSRLLGYRNMHPRLLELFQQIAERFPGHAVEIISGYRKHNPKTKKKPGPHARGVAVDFRLQGIANEVLYDYIRRFDRVGAGYYPNSVHVHLDVRDKKYLWTDVSGRGEKAIYVTPDDPRYFRGLSPADGNGVSPGGARPDDLDDDHESPDDDHESPDDDRESPDDDRESPDDDRESPDVLEDD